MHRATAGGRCCPGSQHPPETRKWNYGTLRRRRRRQQVQRRLHGLCVEYDNERRPLEYKLLSLTYKVLTTSQPSYLNNLISVQPPRSTRSSSVVTLSRQPTISLKITDRSFRYVSGINSLIHSVSLASHVSTHLLLSAHLYYFHHVAQSDDLRFLGVQLSSDCSGVPSRKAFLLFLHKDNSHSR